MKTFLKKGAVYSLLSVAGLLADFTVSNFLYYTFDLHLTLSGFLGFLAGSLVTYFVNLHTTFSFLKLTAEWKSLLRWMRTSFWAAFLRIFLLWIFSWVSALPAIISFLLATILSSGFRTMIGYFYVFKPRS